MATGRSTPRLVPPSLRYVSVMLAAAFAVHELRVVAGYGADAGHVLAAPGHEYLPFLAAAILVLVAAAATRWCMTLVGAVAGHPLEAPRPRPSLVRSWAGAAGALVAIYFVQAGLESVVDPSHPVWSHGGWTAVPIAMVLAAGVVLLLRGADVVVERLASRATPAAPPRVPRVRLRAPGDVAWPRPAALACHLAGRAPPAHA